VQIQDIKAHKEEQEVKDLKDLEVLKDLSFQVIEVCKVE